MKMIGDRYDLADIVACFSATQPRDAHGKWTSGGGATMAPDKGGSFGGGSGIKTEYQKVREARMDTQEKLFRAKTEGQKNKIRPKLYKLQARERELRGKLAKSGALRAKSTGPKLLSPTKRVRGTEYTVKDMDTASKSAGTKLFGKSLEHDGVVELKTRKLSSLKGNDLIVSDFEFMFKPSTGKGRDVSGRTISKSMADKDGKVYLYDADLSRVTVIDT